MSGIMYLGNQMVTPVIVKGGEEKAFNVDGYDWLGEVNSSGELVPPSKPINIVFDGVKTISDSWDSTIFEGDSRIVSVSFPDLEIADREYLFEQFLYDCTNLTSISFPKLRIVGDDSCSGVCESCPNVVSADFSSVEEVGRNGMSYDFINCKKLVELKLGSLRIIGGMGLNNFAPGCELLEEVDLSTIEEVGSNGMAEAFANTKLETVRLTNLNKILYNALYGCFARCSQLKDIYFNSLTTTSFGNYTNQFNYMLSNTGTSVIHTLHFPSSLQSKVETLDGFPTFGGTAGYVVLAFDLPPTE